MSDQQLEQERPVDEPLPERRKPWLGPCFQCSNPVDRPGAPLCDDCDDDLFEESSR